MKKFFVFVMLVLAGCSGGEDDAQINLKKGDEYFGQKEYEVAEYYYEKIPEESPFYAQAEKKLVAIQKIKEQWMDRSVPGDDLTRLIIIDHSYGMDNVMHVPNHRLLIRNLNKRDIASVTLEFTYYDDRGDMIEQLKTEVEIVIKSNDQNECAGINPGRIKKPFTRSTVKIIGAMYQ